MDQESLKLDFVETFTEEENPFAPARGNCGCGAIDVSLFWCWMCARKFCWSCFKIHEDFDIGGD
jgi:hypothetical protein